MPIVASALAILLAGAGRVADEPPAAGARPSATAAETEARGAMPEAFQRQAERRVAEYLPRLRERVRTEDPALNALVERLYAQCVTGKLFDPMPPELPRRWFAPGGEQTSFLVMTERAIAELARELGDAALARRYERMVERRVAAMQAKMWDPEAQFFFSLDRDSDRCIRVRTIQGFLTLAAGVATADQARALARQLEDPKRWWSAFPVPTAAIDEPQFDPRGSWRGDTWPPTTYLVAYGLRRYGEHRLALELTNRLRSLVESRGVYEHYDSRSGEPLGVAGLGMSTTVWSAIVENVYGLQDDFRTVRVPERAAGRTLRLGKLELAYPQDGVVELRTAFARELRVSFAGWPDAALRVTCGGRRRAATRAGGLTAFGARPGERCRVAVVR